MKWLKKHMDQKKEANNAIAARLAKILARLQIKLVAWLQIREARLSLSQKKMILLLFCLLFGLAYISILGRALFGDVSDAAIYRQQIPPVAQPPPFRSTDGAGQKPSGRHQMDSVNKNQ